MLTERRTTTTTTDDSSPVTPGVVVSDWVKEGWKDVHLEWLLLRQEVGMAQVQLQDSYHQGTYEARRLLQEGQKQGQSHLKRNSQTLQREKQRLFQEDVPQLVALGKSLKTLVLERRRRRDAFTPSTMDTDPPLMSPAPPGLPTKEFFVYAIRDFERTLRDPLFLHRLNEEMIPEKLSSCQEMIQYYKQRPELYTYTLTKELSRMNYTVVTEGGQRLTDEVTIREYAAMQRQSQPPEEEEASPPINDALSLLLWKAANQSLFGDIITSLTRETNDGLIRPLFHTATLVNDISMTIDFGRDHPHITAECYLQVILPGGGGGGCHQDHETEAHREVASGRPHKEEEEKEEEKLVVAGALLGVYFCPARDRMEARIVHISPAPLLSDDQVQRVATSLCV